MSKWVVVAGCLLLLVAWRSEGYHQADEHFQILEFAVYKAGGATADDLAWEFDERMRPALQPAIAYVVYQTFGGRGEADPFLVAFFLRLLSAGLAAYVAYRVWVRYRSAFTTPARLALAFALMFHWLAYYNGVRFSSENWSGLLATLGFLTFPLRHSGPGQLTPTGGSSAFGSGMLFGLAFLCRYQIGLLIGGFGVWLLIYNQHAWRDVFRVVVGGLIVVVAAYPLSYWLYGEWTVPAWNYLNQNLIEGKAAGYGTRPFYAYVELVFLRGIPPLSLVYLLAFGYFLYAFRREPLTFMCTAFVLLHSLLARKDIRFLFPLIPLVPILVAGAIGAFDAPRGPKIWQKSWVKWLLVVALVVNSVALLITVIRPPASEIGPAKFVYRNYSRVTLTGPDARIVRAEGTVARYYHRPAYRLRRTCDRAPCLYVHHTPGPGSLPQNGELVYTDRPRWLHELGLGPYLDRFRWWYVYELP